MDDVAETIAKLLKRARLLSDHEDDESRLWRDIVLCIAVQLRSTRTDFDTDEFLEAAGWGVRRKA